MLGNKRIAHTIRYHLVAGLLLVCMAGIGESAYAQVAATGGIVSIEPVTTSRTINEAGGTYEFDVVFEFLPTNATFFRGRRRVSLGFQGGRLLADFSSVLDPRVTPTQDYSVSVDGVEQTLTAVRPTRLGTIYELPFGSIEFGSGSVTGDPLPADRRLTRRIVLTAKDDGVDEGPNTTPGMGTETINLVFNPSNPDGGAPSPPVPGITYTLFRSPIAILDNDTNPPGVTVTPTTLTTTEGGMATFTVVLDTEPAGYEVRTEPAPIPGPGLSTVPVYELTNEVRVTVTSTDPIDGGLVSSVGTTPAISTVLTFTDDGGATPWDTPQSVTVNGADNLVSGSDVTYDITFNADGGTFTPGSLSRPDNNYDAVTVAAVSVTNTDNDGMHGVIVTETGGGTSVAEDGGTDTFTVALSSEPANDVILTLTSSDTNEGTVTPATLTFTRTSGTDPWNTPQTVTLTGVDDNVDRDDTFTVDFAITDGDGANYPLTPSAPVVTVTATDDDTVSTNITLAISPTSIAETADNTAITITAALGGTVVLGTPINITVTPTGESSFTLTIPALSLSGTRTFGIDPVADANTNDETITISGTASGFSVAGTTLTIRDAGLSVFQDMSGGIPITVAVTGATEGAAHTFYVALTRAPTGNVVVAPTSRDPTELTINTPSLTFTTTNWNMRQPVMVTGVDDDVFRTETLDFSDHRVDFSVTSGDGDVYPDTLLLASTNVRVTDNDRVPLVLSASPTDIPESAGATTVTVTAMIMGSTRVANQITQVVRLVDSSGTVPGQASFRSGFFQDGEVVSPPGLITIPPFGDSGTTTFTIDPFADSDVEGREIFSIDPTGTGRGVLSVSKVEIGIVESGVLAFEAQTGGNSIDAVMIAEGSSGTLHVQLASIPATGSSVTIGVTSSDMDEGTVNMATLTFTDTTWETRQAVTVTAVNDDIDRDDTFTVDFEITTTTDTTNYPTTLSIPSVRVTATDDDSAGLSVDIGDGVTTAEGSTVSDTFTVVLDSQPTADVTVEITGLDAGEHTLAPSTTLTFTTGNWSAAQTVTLNSVDDDFVDDDQTYNITLTPTGGGYDSVTPAIVPITNTDDDTAGLTIADLMVDEDAGTATVTVTLTPAVTAGTVTVDAATMDGTATTAGTDYTAITSQTLTFVAGNTSQTLDIPINDDSIDETDETFTVMLDNLMLPAAVTGDVSIADATATVTIIDNDAVSDTINLSVSPPTVAETAGATIITVTATLGGSGVASPTDTTVTVSVGESGDSAVEGTDYATVAAFTLTIPALSSSGMATFMIDPNTSSMNNATVTIDGTATINGMTATINPATLTIVEAGISVHDAMSAGNPISTVTIAEASGTDMLYVQLVSQPAGNVTLSVESDDTNEGMVTPATLTFTTTNWNTRQPVTITAIPDNVDRDGDSFMVDFAVTSGDSANYTTSLALPSVTVTVTDDDTAGFTVDIGDGVTTSEGSTTPDTFSVVLDSQPTGTVTITISGLVAGEHTSAPPTTLTFTPTGTTVWSTRQEITLTGVDDDVVDGDQMYDLTLTPAGGGYDSVMAETVSVTNTDDDTAELTIADLTIDENAGTATLTVTLTPAVTAGDVMVNATTADGTATAGTDYTAITGQTLTFTAGSTSETLDITISDDTIAEGNETFTVMLGTLVQPTGVTTVSIAAADTATVTITDDETAPTTITLSVNPSTIPETAGATEITVTATIDGTVVLSTPTVVTVSVGGGTATSGTDYTAVPNFDLTIPALSLSAMATFMIDPNTSSDNGDTVMITGTAPGFTTINPATLTISEAGISVFDVATGGTSTNTVTIANENSGTMTFYVRLISAPVSDVTLSVTSSDINEGTVLPATLTFTAAAGATSWDTRQMLTVTGVDDNIDRDDTFTVDFAVTTGDGGNYPTNLSIPSVTVTVTDDDTAGIDAYDMATGGSEISAITTSEAAGTGNVATFYVALASQPTDTVTITISGIDSTEHTLTAPASGTLTFTTVNWNAPRQAITVTGVDDDIVDGDQTYNITLTASGGGYDGVVEMGSATNTDDDTAEISIADLSVDENAGTATLTVTLTSAVTAGNVTVDGTTADDTATIAGGDYTAITGQTLTFTAGSTTQTLDIPINDDTIDEIDETFTVTLDNLMLPAAVTGDVSITDATAMVTITDDDTLSDTINLSVSPLTVAETADATTITVTATIDGTAVSTTATAVTVTVGESGDSAVEGTDYATVSDFTLTIPALSSSAMATFMIDPNTSSTNGDIVTISGTAGGFTTINSATLTIVEAGISVHDAMSAGNPISTVTIAEASGTDMLYVQLVSQPAGNVTLSVTSDDTNEGMVTPATLTFTTTNWNTRQPVTVTAVPDNVDRDGDSFMADFAVTSGDSANYTTSLALSVTVTITDDDTLSDTINLSVSPLTVAETADATTITVTATIDGTAVSTTATAVTVTVGESGDSAVEGTDYATVSDFTLTIPALETSGSGTFTMTPVADDESDNEETITISGMATINGMTATVTSTTLTVIEGLNTQQREALHGQLLGVANQATMQAIVDVLSKRLQPRARTEAHGSVAGHVLGLQEGQAVDWQKRLSLVVYSTLQRLDDGGALLVPVDATTFNNSEFALPLEVGESVVVLWGALGSSTVEGGQSDASDYDGDLIAVLLGIDSMIGEHARLGIAASYEHSELDYQLDMTSGDAVQKMTSIQPYLSWQPYDSVGLWLLGGYGFGDYDATESTAGGTTLRAEDADVERWMAALGFHYIHRFGSSGWDMVLNNKALWNRTVRDATRFDDGSLLPKNISANWRARLESEVGYSWTFGDGSVRPYGLASVRWDGGDVVNDDTTFMVDAGGGVELSFASRLSMDFKVRRQVTDGDHEENNVVAVGSFGFAEHADGQGWQVALERSLLGGLSAPEHNKAGFDFEQGDSTPTIGQSPSLQANVGYGRLINPLNDAEAGLLKTYTRFYLDPDENKRHAVGLGFDFASLQVGVESEYNNGELETLLRGHIDF